MKGWRKQGEGDQDAISLASGTYCDPGEDRTRQEFKDESDTNWLLRRYGVNVPQVKPQYGEVDMDIQYQDAVQAHQEVAEALSPEQLDRLFNQGVTPGDGSSSQGGTASPTSVSEAAEAGQAGA